MSIVEINNLVKIYDNNHRAIDGVSLKLEKGKIYGLLGPNGAGKSTLINVLVGLYPPTEGSVTILGAKSGEIKKYADKLGYVPQNIEIYDNLTAYENVEFFAGIYGYKGEELKSRCEEVLKFVGLLDYKKMLAKRFSGGMQRRLNIACALVNRPELIIFDEPTVGIDPQSRNHILESILELNKQGTTIIYTSHYMEEVEKLCSYIYIMDMGKIIAEGSKEKLLLSGKSNSIMVALDNESIDKAKELYNDRVDDNKLVFENKDINDIIDELRKNNIRFSEIKNSANNLEHLFLELTGKNLRD